MATTKKDFEKIDLEFLTSSIKWLNEQKCGCCYKKVAETDGGTGLFIVLGWSDGYDTAPAGTPNADGTWRINSKIAYQHSNNAMQCDFDVDWNMPYNPKTGDVDDTSTEVSATEDEVKRLNDEAWRVWKDWKNELDSLS